MQVISVCWSYILQLYYIHWLALVIFWWCLQGFLCPGLCHLQKVSFTSFPFWIPFISFSSLIAMARTSKTMLNSSGESGQPCLVPDFRWNAFNFSPLRIMFAVGLSYMAFIMLRYVFSMTAFWRILYHKQRLKFVKGFFCIYLDNHMVFIFQFVNVVYYVDWFVDIKDHDGHDVWSF